MGVLHLIAQPLPALMLKKTHLHEKKVIYFVSKQLIRIKLCSYLMVHWEASLDKIACQNVETIPRSTH